MLRLPVHTALLAVTLLLLVSLLGCVEYTDLVRRRIVSPPSLRVRIGRYEVDSTPVTAPSTSWRSGTPPIPTDYNVWLYIRPKDRSGTPHAFRLIHLPLAPP
jgi:hypothetical protein